MDTCIFVMNDICHHEQIFIPNYENSTNSMKYMPKKKQKLYTFRLLGKLDSWHPAYPYTPQVKRSKVLEGRSIRTINLLGLVNCGLAIATDIF